MVGRIDGSVIGEVVGRVDGRMVGGVIIIDEFIDVEKSRETMSWMLHCLPVLRNGSWWTHDDNGSPGNSLEIVLTKIIN